MMVGIFSMILWGALAVAFPSQSPSLTPPQDGQDCKGCHAIAPRQDPKKCPICHFSAVPENSRELKSNTPNRSILPIAQTQSSSSIRDMALISAGSFTMGYDKRHPDEGPSHTMDLPAFYIDRFEITNTEYAKFLGATNRPRPFYWQNGHYPAHKADHPVVMVSWHDANEYCHWAGKRLPKESEWEKAARGTDGRIFPWGDHFDLNKSNSSQRWKSLGQRGDTMPVGSFPTGKSPYGLYDMAGNVWEWTDSWYLPHPGNTHPTENYGHKYRLAKGGSWKDCSFYRCGLSGPTFNRGFFVPDTKTSSFGFRCAKDAAAKKKN
jgi:formylglycine-generating enzyme required for sulfatase activity